MDMLAFNFGGLTFAFSNTTTVESDFSLLTYEKDDARKCLFDFSLGDILHHKQWIDLMNLSLPQ